MSPLPSPQPNDPSRPGVGRFGPLFWSLAGLTGLGAGLASVALLRLLSAIQHVAWSYRSGPFLDAVRRTTPSHRVIVLVGAGVLAGAGALALRAGIRHAGDLAVRIWFHAGRIPLLATGFRAVLSIALVALGAPVGREGALKQAGAGLASWLSDRGSLPPPQRRLLAVCGAAGGLAAAYNLPVSAPLFALEVVLGQLSLELVPPVLLVSLLATGVSRLVLPGGPSFTPPPLALTPALAGWAVVIGGLLGAAGALYVRVLAWTDRLRPKGRSGTVLLPLAVLTLVGGAAIGFPELLGNGKGAVAEALAGHLGWLPLLALPMLRIAGTTLTLGSGAVGGLFMPTLSVGALLGGAIGVAGHWGAPATAPGAYALLGMAAFLAAASHGPLSTILIVGELTGQWALFPAWALATGIAVAVSRRLEGRSLYTARLHESLQASLTLAPWQGAPELRPLVSTAVAVIPAAATHDTVASLLARLTPGDEILVVDERGRLAGRIDHERFRSVRAHGLRGRDLLAADMLRERGTTVDSRVTLTELRALADLQPAARVPVVDRESRRVIGAIDLGRLPPG